PPMGGALAGRAFASATVARPPAGSVVAMQHVQWEWRPRLRTPVLVAAFGGWNDAGDAATLAVDHLVQVLEARRFATLDPEEFYDFQQTRPMVRLADGVTREVVWPANDLYAAGTAGGDVILLAGNEPQLRWRTFCDQILGVARDLGVRQVLTLGALLADVVHSRPVNVIGTSTDPVLIERHQLQRSRYEGPTGIVGVLHDACARADVPSLSLWAAVPAYAQSTPSPKAALALVVEAGNLLGATLDVGALPDAAREYVDEIEAAVADDDDLLGYVRRLEALADSAEDEDEDGDDAAIGEPAELPSLERLVEEVERFLRDQGADGT
ncbi:MAG TPA: PAC2 family protein, partial [Acidimicrobiales bacterium]